MPNLDTESWRGSHFTLVATRGSGLKFALCCECGLIGLFDIRDTPYQDVLDLCAEHVNRERP